jgi:hypothetical protein
VYSWCSLKAPATNRQKGTSEESSSQSIQVHHQPATHITLQSDIMITYITYDDNSLGKVPIDVERVIFDSSVIEIGKSAFYECTSLTTPQNKYESTSRRKAAIASLC